jgi:agmatine deiminase
MITDDQTNFVWFSQLLQDLFPVESLKITSILKSFGIQHDFLKATNDIWCRDYMPVQVSQDKFIQFKYNPWYLNDTPKNKKLKSNPRKVNQANNIQAVYKNINLDGGNVVRWHNKVIITDRIFEENPQYDRTKLLSILENLLMTKVIIVPKSPDDVYGHADGMLRFLDENNVIGNDIRYEDKNWQMAFKKVHRENNLEMIPLPCLWKKSLPPESAWGIYVNYLHVGKLIILPAFNPKKDKFVFNKFTTNFPSSTIRMVEMDAIAHNGGLLNCISWNIIR